MHEKISDVYNTMWKAYKQFLEDSEHSVRPINDAAYKLECKYADNEMILQFIWYQKAAWSGIVQHVRNY